MSQRDIAEQIKALYYVEVSPELVSKLSGRLNPYSYLSFVFERAPYLDLCDPNHLA